MREIIKYYIIASVITLVILHIISVNVWMNSTSIVLFNIITFFTYSIIIYTSRLKFVSPSGKTLVLVTLSYSFLVVFVLKLLFYYHHGDFFEFQRVDSLTYDRLAREALVMGLIESINFFLSIYQYDDLGALLYISTLYRIIPDTLFVNFLNLICGVIAANVLYKTARFYMHPRYAFMTSITFFSSSFVFLFHSSGLKESLFILIVLSSSYYFLNYINNRQIGSLFFSVVLGLLILLLRPAVLAMLVAAFGISMALNRYGSSTRNLIIAAFMAIAFIYMSGTLDRLMQTFTSFEQSIMIREDATSLAGERIAIYAAALSSFLGPLPNVIVREGKENNSLYAMGLILRVLLAVPFWLGFILIIKKRLSQFFPFLLFSVMGMGALFFIMESYELRYHITYLPFVYLIAFYYLSHYDAMSKNAKSRTGLFIRLSYISLVVLILFWNFRMV